MYICMYVCMCMYACVCVFLTQLELEKNTRCIHFTSPSTAINQ